MPCRVVFKRGRHRGDGGELLQHSGRRNACVGRTGRSDLWPAQNVDGCLRHRICDAVGALRLLWHLGVDGRRERFGDAEGCLGFAFRCFFGCGVDAGMVRGLRRGRCIAAVVLAILEESFMMMICLGILTLSLAFGVAWINTRIAGLFWVAANFLSYQWAVEATKLGRDDIVMAANLTFVLIIIYLSVMGLSGIVVAYMAKRAHKRAVA